MAYRYNNIECDTFEELQRLTGARAAPQMPAKSVEHDDRGACYNPAHRDDCGGRNASCARQSARCCSKDGDCLCDRK